VDALKAYSRAHPREGYRKAHQKVADLLDEPINHKRVERLWRLHDLAVPKKRRRRRRGKSTCGRPPVPLYPNHVWTYDFMEDSCVRGRKLRFLTVVDELTRESLTIEVRRSFPAKEVIAVLRGLFMEHGAPRYLRSDNGPEFIAQAIQQWLERAQVSTVYIEPGKPWQNGLCESFNGRLRDECLDMEVFYGLKDARVITQGWRRYYNAERPHGSLGYQSPLEFKRKWLEEQAHGAARAVRSLTHRGHPDGLVGHWEKLGQQGVEKERPSKQLGPSVLAPAAALGSLSSVALSSRRAKQTYLEPSQTARKKS